MKTALVTASYAGDFERCRLLCETVDARVTGLARHYLLVAGHDVALFRQLETANRIVVDERDLLPRWLKVFRDPLSGFSRYIWLSGRTMPLRGWHVQQLRRLAMARHGEEDAFLYSDSDVVFVKPFDAASLWRDQALRLYRRDDALPMGEGYDHATWSRNAADLLGITQPALSKHDYIATLIAWRRDTLTALLAHIEDRSSRHWAAAIGRRRKFSECTIYGRFADEVEGGDNHFHDAENLCLMRWDRPFSSTDELDAMIGGLTGAQVAIGVQSFLGMEPDEIRSRLPR